MPINRHHHDSMLNQLSQCALDTFRQRSLYSSSFVHIWMTMPHKHHTVVTSQAACSLEDRDSTKQECTAFCPTWMGVEKTAQI